MVAPLDSSPNFLPLSGVFLVLAVVSSSIGGFLVSAPCGLAVVSLWCLCLAIVLGADGRKKADELRRRDEAGE